MKNICLGKCITTEHAALTSLINWRQTFADYLEFSGITWQWLSCVLLNWIHSHFRLTIHVGAGNILRNGITFPHRDGGTRRQLHMAYACGDIRECDEATGKESWPGQYQERAAQETTSTLCQQGQWQLAWWQKWPDVPKARTRQGFFFRFLSVTSKSLGGHYICSIQAACLGSVCLHLSSANILYCFSNCLAVWSVLLYSTTCLSKNDLTGGWPHAKTQLGNWLSRRGCEFNPAFIPNNKQRRGMLEHQPLNQLQGLLIDI